MMTKFRLLSCLALIGVATSCGGDSELALDPGVRVLGRPARVTLVLLDSVVPSGASVRVRQINTGGVALYYNHCGRRVERRTGGTWTLEPPDLRVCTAEVFTLPAGATADVVVDAPTAAGEYRFVLAFMPVTGGESGVARTESLQVSAASPPLLP